MRICIPIEATVPAGGAQFLANLERYLQEMDIATTHRLNDSYDVLFTSHWLVPRAVILHAIRQNPEVRIVQRIGGSAQDYGRKDDADERQRAVNRLADLTIFQSQYCRYATREKFPVIGEDGPVIYNPVDVELFDPEGPRRDFPEPFRLACVTWSTNVMKGAFSIYEVARRHPELGFVLCGRYPDAPDLPNLHVLGVLERGTLATVLRSCHALLTFSQNEACPNHVLEALASGLPILYHNSGAMPEIVGDCGLPVTVDSFPEQLERLVVDRERRSAAARQRALEMFNPDQALSKYVEVIEAATKRPLRISSRRRALMAWADLPCGPFRAAADFTRRQIHRLDR